MRFKRLLTVGLMALLSAGTAMATSQLNSVQVTPSPNSAKISLRTTGSYAHKEYRPDDHLLLVDLNGVSVDQAVERTASFNSPVLKGYKLTRYTSASGGEVARLEFTLGDGVKLDVADKSDGLEILMSTGASAAATPAGDVAAATSAASPIVAANAAPNVAPNATPVTPATEQKEVVKSVAKPSAEASAKNSTPAIIRNVSVQRGQGSMDVVIEGANAAHPFLLHNPDRLVIDLANSVLRASVKNVLVHDQEVHQVRVGRFQAEPPVTRVVIDLAGPHAFDVVSSSQAVIVRIKTGEMASTAASAPAPTATTEPAQTAAAEPSSKPEPEQAAAVVPLSNPEPAPTVAAAPLPKPEPAPAAKTPEPTQAVVKTPVFSDATQVQAATPAPRPTVVLASASVPKIAPVTQTDAPAESDAPHAVVIPTVQTAQPAPPAAQKVATVEPAPAPATAKVEPAPTHAPATHEVAAQEPAERATQAAETVAASTPKKETVASAKDTPVMAQTSTSTATPESAQTPAAPTVLLAQNTNPAPPQPAPSTPSPSVAAQLATPQAQKAAEPKYTGEPISVNLKDVDLKDFFRLIHEISGLNIVLDPSVHGTVTLVLDDVPWDQALDIVLKNNALDRELQGNVLRIAATDTLRKEAVDRRAQSEAVALAVDRQTITRFLSYGKAAQLVATVKKFLTARGDVIADERTNALIISDIPSVLPTLDRLISQMDRRSQQVEIEVRVVSATRSFSRDLGVQLGLSWANGVTTLAGSNPNGTSSTTTTTSGNSTTTTTTAAPTVPLFTTFNATGATTGFSISNITKSYGIDAVLTAAESHNLAKVLSRPRIVTQSNIKAEVKQGVKIPVYTASTNNANASVSYVDAVLRLSVTPQITADGTIFLTVDVENTQPSGTINSNYILTTQQATTQVLVSDGGTVVIGGVIQTTNTVSTSQTPFLGNIPWLGNLFKERLVKTETDELIFFITPKIIQT